MGAGGDTIRIAIIADIHENLIAFGAVLAEIGRDGIESIVCLVDLVLGAAITIRWEQAGETMLAPAVKPSAPTTLDARSQQSATDSAVRESSVMKQLQRSFGSQFARPHGPLGRLVAGMMRRGNAPLNLWMVEILEVDPADRVLEVGFGPGVALAELLSRAPTGFVAGVDVSESMVRQAQSRHSDSIAAGRLELRQGDAGSLPYDDATFDKACGAHVIYFWPDPVRTVQELRRVLRPGGKLALGYQEQAHMPPRAVTGLTQAGARLIGPGDVEQVVLSAGFEEMRLETRQTSSGPGGFCVLATK